MKISANLELSKFAEIFVFYVFINSFNCVVCACLAMWYCARYQYFIVR